MRDIECLENAMFCIVYILQSSTCDKKNGFSSFLWVSFFSGNHNIFGKRMNQRIQFGECSLKFTEAGCRSIKLSYEIELEVFYYVYYETLSLFINLDCFDQSSNLVK